MSKEELIEFLKESLEIRIDFHKAYSYWDNNEIKVELLINGEMISEYRTSVPE